MAVIPRLGLFKSMCITLIAAVPFMRIIVGYDWCLSMYFIDLGMLDLGGSITKGDICYSSRILKLA